MANEPTPGQAASEGVTENPATPAPAAASENITATPPAPAAASENITATPPAPPPPAAAAPAPSAPAPMAAAGPGALPAWLLKADVAILAMLLLLTFFLGSFTAANSDVWMHLAIGQRISAGEFTFGEDPFSWLTEATDDRPASFWVHQSWLYSWLFFQLHELVGGGGLVFVKALLCTIAVGLLSRIGWNETNRWFVLITLVTAVLAVSPRLLLQPVVISLLFLSITLFVLDRVGFFCHARPDGKTPCPRSLWALPPLFALWANLDAWFILGPIVLGLCWAGAALTRWFPHAKVVPTRTLGLVFGAGVLACVLNPYHVRVFQLPPELGYIVVAVTDALHLKLPNDVVGAGRTLSEMRKADSDPGWTLTALSSKYWYEPARGLNIAGIAFYPLVLLGLLAFTLTALMKPQPGAPLFHVGRFALWLVFGVMALALYRMIPFFVVIAAPLTAMTLGEFLNWQQTVSAVPAQKRDRGLKLARIISIPFVLLLLFLAWPGWLGVMPGAQTGMMQGSSDFASQRRVAWDLRAEPSLKRTAEMLQALKNKGECANVFNGMSLEVADYLAWFAPDVKYGMDSRFALYAERVPGYINARKALPAPNSTAWEEYFVKHNVDQVTVANFVKRDGSFPSRWWLDVDQWRQRDGDNKMVAFSWAGRDKAGRDKQWPADDDDAWNKEAFGPVPKERRPPAAGTPTPENPGNFALYLDGVGPTPIGVPEFLLLKRRFEVFGEIRSKGHHVGIVWMYASLSGVKALPGGSTEPALIVMQRWTGQPMRDIGPPALPILMMRSTRKAVFENPLDTRCRSCLIEAAQARNHQENYWAGAYGVGPGRLRDRVRQLQQITSLYALTQLEPDNFETHMRLAGVYFNQEKMYDLALEHMQAAEKALEARRPSRAEEQKAIEATLKKLREEVKNLDKFVRQRVAKWKELPGSPFQKAMEAYAGKFQELQGNQPVEARYGLGKKALEILLEIKPETLPDEQRLVDMQLRYSLLLATGHADRVMASLKEVDAKKSLPPPVFAQNLLFAGAALGDYEAVDEALASIEKSMQADLKKSRAQALELAGQFAPAVLMLPRTGSAAALAGAAVGYPRAAKEIESGIQVAQVTLHNELGNAVTLRGIMALEAGNTAHARTLFQRAIDEAGDTYFFTERPIARRYLELLNEQKR